MTLPTRAKVLICSEQFPACTAAIRARLPACVEVRACAAEEVPHEIVDAHVAIPYMTRLTAQHIGAAQRLRLIHQWGVGLEGVDIGAASERGVAVCNIPALGSGNDVSVAEHALFLLFSLLRDARGLRREFRRHVLGVPLGETLQGKRCTVLGYGSIGRALASRMRALGCHVIAIRRAAWSEAEAAQVDEAVSVGEGGGQRASLHDALRRAVRVSDVLALCCPQTPSTLGIVDAEVLAREAASPQQQQHRSSSHGGVYLVNVARGGIVDYGALRDALQSGAVAGAALDVFWSEPFDPSDPIADEERYNVVCTGHVGGHTTHANALMGDALCDNVRRALADAIDGIDAPPGQLQSCVNEGSVRWQ